MTLDEAIKKYKERAEEQERYFNQDGIESFAVRHDVCAEEHRQLAEWLKELKRLKEQIWSLDDAREDFLFDVYNILDFLPTNDEANRIIEVFDRVTSDIRQEPILDKIRAEIREWYWQADKQALTKDPCVVDAMIDLFIRTINKYKAESEDKE